MIVTIFLTLIVFFSCPCQGYQDRGNRSMVPGERFTSIILTKQETQDIITTCKNKRDFALTFDDGPYIYENQISDYLNARGIKGSFFVNGNNYACVYDDQIVRQLQHTFQQGHLIGSHTWSHPDISKLTETQFHQQLDWLEIALQKILGIKPKYFRPPFGSIADHNIRILKSRGYKIINWSFDSEDSIGATPQKSKSYYDQVAKAYPEPQIALNHETYETTASQVIPYAIAVLQKSGYRLVSLTECLGLGNKTEDLYQAVGKPSQRDNSWKC